MPNTGHNLEPSMSNRTRSHKLSMPNTWHDLDLSMSAIFRPYLIINHRNKPVWPTVQYSTGQGDGLKNIS